MKFLMVIMCFGLMAGVRADGNKALADDLGQVHPYAFYLLAGGEFLLADTQDGVMSVNADKYRNDSSEVAGRKVFHQDAWTGFTAGETTFKYKVFQRLLNPDYVVVACIYNGGGSGSFARYLLIRRQVQSYYDEGAVKTRNILCNEGSLGVVEPPYSEIIKLNRLIEQHQL